MDRICRNCKFYEPLGTEDSGLNSGWTYITGKCTNAKSVHGGWDPRPGYRTPPRENLADWASCWLFKPRKKQRRQRNG